MGGPVGPTGYLLVTEEVVLVSREGCFERPPEFDDIARQPARRYRERGGVEGYFHWLRQILGDGLEQAGDVAVEPLRYS